jgi:uncharacterized membrane protein (UPF0127 family)
MIAVREPAEEAPAGDDRPDGDAGGSRPSQARAARPRPARGAGGPRPARRDAPAGGTEAAPPEGGAARPRPAWLVDEGEPWWSLPGIRLPRWSAPGAGFSTRWLRRTVAVLLVLGVGGFLVDGANRPANPHLVAAPDPAAGRGSPGYGSATLSVGPAKRQACVLEAVTPTQQAHGLMDRTTVAPYAGMAFVFATPSREYFYMKDTLIPLSIAWFDGSGGYIASLTMPPCPPTTAACPTYRPNRPYSLAVEVPAGRLGALGIGPGSTAQLGGPCA